MIEVLVAGFILTVGMLGFAGLMVSSIAANTRSRGDSTSIMLAQSTLDQIGTTVLGGATTTVQDCSGGAPMTLNTAAGGATTTTSDEIDWTQAASGVPAGYKMSYVICASTNQDTSNTQQRTYDLRWTVKQVDPSDPQTYLVIVGARPKNYTSNLKFFSLPVNLKMYIGPHSTTP